MALDIDTSGRRSHNSWHLPEVFHEHAEMLLICPVRFLVSESSTCVRGQRPQPIDVIGVNCFCLQLSCVHCPCAHCSCETCGLHQRFYGWVFSDFLHVVALGALDVGVVFDENKNVLDKCENLWKGSGESA